jgi:predicted enzyme related to lactoylglutathione lyase
MSSIVRAVMFFVDEPAVVAHWWADLLECPNDRMRFEDGFAWFNVGDIEFGFHPSDAEKNSIGGSPVVYLRVDDHSVAVARAESKGARLHRGPLAIDDARSIAQMVDPFGNVFGIDGPNAYRRSLVDQP